MTKEGSFNEKEDMQIDVHPGNQQLNKGSHEFSFDYLKVYYGMQFSL